MARFYAGGLSLAVVTREIDVQHLGRSGVIYAFVVDGLVIDPGPASCLDTLLAGLDGEEPRALLLTHIHLDHAGASGVLVRRFPNLKIYVHERGAPHLIDPSKLLNSATRLYGDRMEELWGEVAPVPAENLIALSGGETVEGLQVAYTPGHASHHVCYFDERSGDAFTGDVAGVTTPPARWVLPPTPPPDIDLELWNDSLDTLLAWDPARVCITHAGAFGNVGERVEELRGALARFGELAHDTTAEQFVTALRAEVIERSGGDEEAAERFFQAGPPEQLYAGLERYWRKRAERE